MLRIIKVSCRLFKPLQLSNRIIFRFSNQPNKPNQKTSDDSPYISKQQMIKKNDQQMLKENPLQENQSYQKSSSNTGMYILVITSVSLLLIYAMMEIQSVRAQKKQKPVTGLTKVTSSGKATIGGQWQLIDINGKPFGSKNLQGSYYLIYFGFTNCPDICPNSLMKLSKALQKVKKMPQARYFELKIVFVSVDPDRDSPQKIKKFLDFFSKDIIGVTAKSNNDPDLKECLKKFKIYSTKIEFEDDQSIKKGRKSYTIDHTVLTYLMDDQNQYLTHLGGNLGEHDMAQNIVNAILKRQQQKMKKMKV